MYIYSIIRSYLNTINSIASILFFISLWRCDPTRVMASSFLRFLDHTQRRTIVGRTAMDDWSARRRDLSTWQYTQHSQQTNIHAPGGIRTHDPSRRAAADPRLRPRGLWDRPEKYIINYKLSVLGKKNISHNQMNNSFPFVRYNNTR